MRNAETEQEEFAKDIKYLQDKHNKEMCELTERFKIQEALFHTEIECSLKRIKFLEEQVGKLIDAISALTQKINKW